MARKAKKYARKDIREMAEMYLNTSQSISVCSKRLGISPSMGKKLLERAVIERVVTSEEVDDMESKEARNCREYGGEGAVVRIKNHFAELRKQRREFQLSDSDKALYTRLYAFSGYTLEHMAQVFFMAQSLLEEAIEGAVKDNLVDDSIVNEVVNALVDDKSGGKLLAEDESLMEIRAQNIQIDKMQRQYDRAVRKAQKMKNCAGNQTSFLDDDDEDT